LPGLYPADKLIRERFAKENFTALHGVIDVDSKKKEGYP
jgi:hypothetical protein